MTHKIRYYFRVCVLIGAAALCSRVATAQEPTSTDRRADRETITAMLGAWEEAWNRHDMRAFASLFHDDGVWILWTGDTWLGREAIEEGHAEAHRAVFRNSIQRERLEELRFVGPDAAVV